MYDPRFLADSGRLFFNSLDALVPKDINGQVDATSSSLRVLVAVRP